MVLFGCAVLFLVQFLVVYIRNDHVWQKRVSTNVHMVSSIHKATSVDNVRDGVGGKGRRQRVFSNVHMVSSIHKATSVEGWGGRQGEVAMSECPLRTCLAEHNYNKAGCSITWPGKDA